jgi:hypothetical protein
MEFKGISYKGSSEFSKYLRNLSSANFCEQARILGEEIIIKYDEGPLRIYPAGSLMCIELTEENQGMVCSIDSPIRVHNNGEYLVSCSAIKNPKLLKVKLNGVIPITLKEQDIFNDTPRINNKDKLSKILLKEI